MQALFWISVAFMLYVYAGYALVLAVWAKLASRRAAQPGSGAELPGVTVIIAARDEAARLPGRVEWRPTGRPTTPPRCWRRTPGE
jgi:hypothetical protein